MKRQNIVHLTQTALMTAILIVLGMIPGIPLGFIPVPIVLQNMGVMMAGEILGPKEGTTSVALLLLLVAVGFPFLTGGSGGIAVFAGPTGGYLLAWLFAPLLIGSLRQHFGSRWSWWQEFLMIVLADVLFIDITGSLWLSWQSHIKLTAALMSNLAFIPGDLIKAGVAVAVARQLRRVPVLNLG